MSFHSEPIIELSLPVLQQQRALQQTLSPLHRGGGSKSCIGTPLHHAAVKAPDSVDSACRLVHLSSSLYSVTAAAGAASSVSGICCGCPPLPHGIAATGSLFADAADTGGLVTSLPDLAVGGRCCACLPPLHCSRHQTLCCAADTASAAPPVSIAARRPTSFQEQQSLAKLWRGQPRCVT